MTTLDMTTKTADDHLTDYSFTDNNDGTYDLEFT